MESFSPCSPDWAKGAVHEDEIAFVFGLPLLVQQLYTLKEIELSTTMMNAWKPNSLKVGQLFISSIIFFICLLTLIYLRSLFR
jgi:hypothetical protein